MRPRIRSIKPEMWEDEKIVALSRDARLLLLGLVTMADDEGRFRARRSTILGHAFPDDDDAPELLNRWVGEIKKQGLVVFYVVDETPYGAFRNWRRHQKINKPSPSELPAPPDAKVLRDNRIPRREHSGSATGGLPEGAGSSHSPARRRALRSDPILIRSLCEQLATHMQRNDQKSCPDPGSDRWLTDMRLLVSERGDGEEVRRIIDWCQTDPFWRSNILSPGKLRKQFTQLVLKAGAAVDGNVVPLARSAALRQVDGFLDAPEYQQRGEAG